MADPIKYEGSCALSRLQVWIGYGEESFAETLKKQDLRPNYDGSLYALLRPEEEDEKTGLPQLLRKYGFQRLFDIPRTHDGAGGSMGFWLRRSLKGHLFPLEEHTYAKIPSTTEISKKIMAEREAAKEPVAPPVIATIEEELEEMDDAEGMNKRWDEPLQPQPLPRHYRPIGMGYDLFNYGYGAFARAPGPLEAPPAPVVELVRDMPGEKPKQLIRPDYERDQMNSIRRGILKKGFAHYEQKTQKIQRRFQRKVA